jgi:hypothetical protein
MKNTLWRPAGKKPKFGLRIIKRDPLCADVNCCKRDTCSPGPCFFLSRINGKTETKEKLMSDVHAEEMEFKNYNAELAEKIEHYNHRIDEVMDLTDLRDKALSLLLLAGFKKAQIAKLFNCTRGTIYNHLHK